MQAVSSRWTLALKLLLPAFWFSFALACVIFSFFVDLSQVSEPFTPFTIRMILLSTLFSTAAIYYMLFYDIYWISIDTEKWIVSNYFKAYTYNFDSIERIDEYTVAGIDKVKIHLHQEGSFGQEIVFMPSYYWLHFKKTFPQVFEHITIQKIKK